MVNDKKKELKKKEPKLLSQGTYGCIYRPGISCDGSISNSVKYITKIQKQDETSKRENEIGKLVLKMPNHTQYYAPVMESCNVSLAKIDGNEIEKCDFIKNEREESYETNKIRYVGKNTLGKEMLQLFKKQPAKVVKTILHNYRRLLDGFDKLNKAGVIHYDIKDNNIMCDAKNHNPIIIDFGLSIDINKIGENDYADAFYVYGPDYMPWCIDIAFLSYYSRKLKAETNTIKVDIGFMNMDSEPTGMKDDNLVKKEEVNKIIDDFCGKNDVTTLLSREEVDNYKKILNIYFKQMIGKTWKSLRTELLKNKMSWDNYGLSVMLLLSLDNFHIIESNKENNQENALFEYIQLLKKNILSEPMTRQTCEETLVELEKKRIDKRKFNDLQNRIIIQSQQSGSYEKIENEMSKQYLRNRAL